MTVFENRVRKAYLRKRTVRQVILFTLLLLIFVAPYLVVARLDSATECLVPAPRICMVEWCDTVSMYEVGK